MGSEVIVQMFKCCVTDDQPSRRPPGRRRIDRSMIGNPTDFRHTAHIGATDLGGGGAMTPTSADEDHKQHLQLQSQMKSKGGYEMSMQVSHIINARSLDEIKR